MKHWLRFALILFGTTVILASTALSAPIRKWTDSSGAFSVLAELVEVKDGKAHLKKADGSVIAVPVDKLSEADQKFLASLTAGKPATPSPKAPSDSSPRPPAKSTNPTPRVPKVGREAIEQALQKPAPFDFADKPLSEALDNLAEQSGIVVFLDRKSLIDAGVDLDTPVTARSARTDTLATGLKAILEKLKLGWAIRNEVLMVTTKDNLEGYHYLEVRTYVIMQVTDWDALVEAVTAKVAPTTWAEVGGAGSMQRLPPGNLAAVLQTNDVHRALVKEFSQVLQPVSTTKARVRPKTMGKPGEGAAAKRALAETTSCEFTETPLKEVAEAFATRHKIAIELDEKALADAGVAADTLISLRLPGVKLESALNIILKQLDLDFFLDKAGLTISTREVADAKLVKVAYDVQDIIPNGDFDSLIDAITGVIQPVSWTIVGGTATLEPDRDRGALVVEQTYAGHVELERLFSDMRSAQK